MRALDAYYIIKPFVPRTIQLTLRRALAARKRRTSAAVWPIDQNSAKHPPGWRGWPGGKAFALVLVHDVDTAAGARQALALMEAERGLGFRSSFNFVPERYQLDPAIRQDLVNSGFEVGVHGLKHDGKLFKNKKVFNERASRINAYLRSWRSVGFSSPSMLRNPSWLTELNIEYSCSSFDTDPFEPQNDAAGTIFPYLVKNLDESRSYVELPYTLPQDHCLFVILKESDLFVWKQKLAWIAACGGMALLISHPDYMSFNNSRRSTKCYPARYYLDFLAFIAENYSDRFWHPLPRDMAGFWRTETIVNPSGLPSPEASSLSNEVMGI